MIGDMPLFVYIIFTLFWTILTTIAISRDMGTFQTHLCMVGCTHARSFLTSNTTNNLGKNGLQVAYWICLYLKKHIKFIRSLLWNVCIPSWTIVIAGQRYFFIMDTWWTIHILYPLCLLGYEYIKPITMVNYLSTIRDRYGMVFIDCTSPLSSSDVHPKSM